MKKFISSLLDPEHQEYLTLGVYDDDGRVEPFRYKVRVSKKTATNLMETHGRFSQDRRELKAAEVALVAATATTETKANAAWEKAGFPGKSEVERGRWYGEEAWEYWFCDNERDIKKYRKLAAKYEKKLKNWPAKWTNEVMEIMQDAFGTRRDGGVIDGKYSPLFVWKNEPVFF